MEHFAIYIVLEGTYPLEARMVIFELFIVCPENRALELSSDIPGIRDLPRLGTGSWAARANPDSAKDIRSTAQGDMNNHWLFITAFS